MRQIDTQEIYNAVYRLAADSVVNVDKQTLCLLQKACGNETNPLARFALETIVQNDNIAAQQKLPACQDTGMAVIFLEVGQAVHFTGEFINDAINRAVKDAYTDNYFRKSVAHPLNRKNTGTNTPAVIHTEITEGDKVTVTFLAKGFGSENMSRLYMLTPSQGIEGVKNAVLETVKLAGANPCPPVIVGVGIGGTMEKAALLSKKALLRETGKPSSDDMIAGLEAELLKLINETRIGAQGFGGQNTALGVAIETFPTHIAGLPVAVNIQCHAVRHASLTL